MEVQTPFFSGLYEFGVKKNWFLTVKKVVSV